jgi:hypothetical protein
MRTPLPLAALVLLAALATGCAASRTDAPSGPAPQGEPAGGDVVLDGISLVGRWEAVGALDEPDVDSDLRSGVLTETLVVERGGRALLTGEDRRAETGRVTFEGRISGDRLTLEDRPGAATITVRGDGRIVVTDPRGNRTVYERA